MLHNLKATIWIETRKALRSRMPVATALGFLLLPMISAFLMFVYKNPELARSSGLVGAKANLTAATADWPTYLGLLMQATSLAGFFLFSIICIWVFGREFADGTVKDLLALPVARSSILLAKFVVVTVWCLALAVEIFAVTLVLGILLDLPGASASLILDAAFRMVITSVLVVAVALPSAFFASAGRGYLPAVGVALVAVLLANVIATIGWGEYFPWAVPALFSGAGGNVTLSIISFGLVLLTGLAGMLGTYSWWQYADQNR